MMTRECWMVDDNFLQGSWENNLMPRKTKTTKKRLILKQLKYLILQFF